MLWLLSVKLGKGQKFYLKLAALGGGITFLLSLCIGALFLSVLPWVNPELVLLALYFWLIGAVVFSCPAIFFEILFARRMWTTLMTRFIGAIVFGACLGIFVLLGRAIFGKNDFSDIGARFEALRDGNGPQQLCESVRLLYPQADLLAASKYFLEHLWIYCVIPAGVAMAFLLLAEFLRNVETGKS